MNTVPQDSHEINQFLRPNEGAIIPVWNVTNNIDAVHNKDLITSDSNNKLARMLL